VVVVVGEKLVGEQEVGGECLLIAEVEEYRKDQSHQVAQEKKREGEKEKKKVEKEKKKRQRRVEVGVVW